MASRPLCQVLYVSCIIVLLLVFVFIITFCTWFVCYLAIKIISLSDYFITCYTCSPTVLTRRISVCTEMMALPHSPWQESRLIKPEKILYGFSNHVDLVSQSRLCFDKLISWMLRLIFHQGSIGLTVSQTMSPSMWMLSQIIHQSWSNISQWISLKDSLLYLVTRMS